MTIITVETDDNIEEVTEFIGVINKTLEGFHIRLDRGLSENEVISVCDAIRAIKGIAFTEILKAGEECVDVEDNVYEQIKNDVRIDMKAGWIEHGPLDEFKARIAAQMKADFKEEVLSFFEHLYIDDKVGEPIE